ncbi:hypothetical protein GCM10009838_00880 [Catenulispora subtropica]|uniref:Xaa-Pro dipeptidyl-peptidase C-terminal domain-containing protein n=1 Tax=Catenulispora subtropica TaxID=450798 RepID=A0ABN2QCK8_9ACTN
MTGATTALLLGLLPAATATSNTTTDDTAGMQRMHWVVNVGPGRATQCTIDGAMYVPADASPSHPVPAIIVAHGFGLNYTFSEGMAEYFYQHDYAVLVYSHLGSGDSTCGTNFADPQWDGAAASQLIDYLGGDPVTASSIDSSGNATPAPPRTDIVHDAVDHDGIARRDDPRVGMFGESLGAGVQLSVASFDHRLDALVPSGSWNTIQYSIAPNDADLASDSDTVSKTPGTFKESWASAFGLLSFLNSVGNQQVPSLPCLIKTAVPAMCQDLFDSAVQGYLTPGAQQIADNSAIGTYGSKIITPSLLLYGEQDDLMTLKDGIADYRQLKANGTPVKMIWNGGDHLSGLDGDASFTAPDQRMYEIGQITDWFDHYLKDSSVDTGPSFAYVKQWAIDKNNPDKIAAVNAAYQAGDTIDLPTVKHEWYLSAGGTLVDDPKALAPDIQAFVSGWGDIAAAAVASVVWQGHGPYPDTPNLGGIATQWQTPALTAPVTVVGEPTVDVNLISPSAAGNIAADGVAGMDTGVAKIYDIDAHGNATLVNQQTAPFRVSDVTKPVHIVFSPLTWQFKAGDKIQIVISGFDLKYAGSKDVNTNVIISGSTLQGLTLPTISG